jgi:uncharacterized membrane protein YfcA
VAVPVTLALSGLDAAALVVIGLAAGIFNGVAGGGQLLIFPALLAMGIPALSANVTSTVGIVPSYVGGVVGFRRQLEGQGRRLRSLLPWALVGAATGAILLLVTPAGSFRSLVPWLVLLATVLFAVQPLIVRLVSQVSVDHASRRALLFGGTFVVAVYGGYFGAAMGVMMLALYGLALVESLATTNGIRSVLSILIGTLSAVIFIIHGEVVWLAAGALAVGCALGGFAGARLALWLPVPVLRGVIVLVGMTTGLVLLAT